MLWKVELANVFLKTCKIVVLYSKYTTINVVNPFGVNNANVI